MRSFAHPRPLPGMGVPNIRTHDCVRAAIHTFLERQVVDVVSLTTLTQMCKVMRSLGISKVDEHNIENHMVKMLRSNGPEYVVERLKELSEWRKSSMYRSNWTAPEWHKTTGPKNRPRPASPMEATLWKYRGKAFYAAVGAMRMAISYEIPTEKQLTKWVKAIRINNPGTPVCLRASANLLRRLERRIAQKWQGRQPFDTRDITGTCIPGYHRRLMLKVVDGYAQPGSLLSAMEMSIRTAPPFVYQFLEDIDATYRMAARENLMIPKQDFIDEMNEFIRAGKENPAAQDAALGFMPFSEEVLMQHRRLVTDRLGFGAPVGQIGFLEKPGGKLRTVANPNRFVQWVNVPLGEALSEEVNRLPGVYVQDQESGKLQVQSWISNRKMVGSFDLSSATDTLDYKAFLHSYFQVAYETDAFPLLRRSLELFEDTSDSPWVIPGEIADAIDSPDCTVSWSQGQPLGLRPSFPILTLMNWCAAYEACLQDCREAGVKMSSDKIRDNVAIVGDDCCVCGGLIPKYSANIQSMGGITNLEKTMVSQVFGEFCSTMISKDTMYPLKPRFVFGRSEWCENIEKFQCLEIRKHAPKEEVRRHDELGAWHFSGCLNVPKFASPTARPLPARLIANALLEEFAQREMPDQQYMSLENLYMRSLSWVNAESPTTEFETVRGGEKFGKVVVDNHVDELGTLLYHTVEDVTTRAIHEVKAKVKTAPRKCVRLTEQRATRGVELRACFDIARTLNSLSIYGRTQVPVGPLTVYDWRSDRYVMPERKLKAYRKLQKILKDPDVQYDRDGVLMDLTIKKSHQVTAYLNVEQNAEGRLLCEVTMGSRRVLLDLTSSVISRALSDPALSDAIKDACRQRVMERERELQRECTIER